MWQKFSESLHRKVTTVKLPEAAVTLLFTYAPRGKQRSWRITRPTRVGATCREGNALQLKVGCPAVPTQGQERRKKGLRRRPKSCATYKAPRAGFAMPTVGVTVLPKRVLAKHRTNQTTNCHSLAKNRKGRRRDHQQHKHEMKETTRKQKHPNWVVRVRRRRRNATATKQTSPKKT